MSSKGLLLVAACSASVAAFSAATDGPGVIARTTRDYDRGEITWYRWAKPERIEQRGIERDCSGWVEFDVEVERSQWYEFWQSGVTPEWTRDFYLDGDLVRFHYCTDGKADREDVKRSVWTKDFNVHLTKGRHTIRLRRLGFPGNFSREWKLVPAEGNPQGSFHCTARQTAVRVGDPWRVTVTGGARTPTAYDVAVVSATDGTTNVLGEVSFPATDRPLAKDVDLRFTNEGVYDLLCIGRDLPAGVRARPSDAGSVQVAAVEMTPPERPTELKRTLVVDIDCVREAPYREKDGATRIVRKAFGAYRESSGRASHAEWALDGFSYKAVIPDATNIYQLVVDYPDDAFRSMGFWTMDQVVVNGRGVTLTGGVETGLQYRNTQGMLTHEAFLYPQDTNLVVSAINLNHGSRAAASRIRLYRVDGELPACAPFVSRGRVIGSFFEEFGRWKRHFGMRRGGNLLMENMRSMENWAKWNSFSGYNMMHPAVVAYNNVLYPSLELQGESGMARVNEMRILGLYAEKYGNVFIPHVTVKESDYVAKDLGVTVRRDRVDGKSTVSLSFDTPEAKDLVCVDRKGRNVISWTPYIFNALHPKVQEKFIAIIGEAADSLADLKSFGGLCVRIPVAWQFNGMMGLYYGDMDYGDWTIAQFEKETGIKVPGASDDPARYEARYRFLMGPQKDAWLNWRAQKMHEYYRRILARIQKARPSAKLYLMWWGDQKRLKESGIDLARFRDEKDIGFFLSGKGYGRRYFMPLGNARCTDVFGNPAAYESCTIGLRACDVIGDYYEVNESLKWEELGVRKGVAFDSCAPSGVNELEHFALALAKADVTAITAGGNGWMFGTPRLQGPFVREYASLPTDRFDLCAVGTNDPVAVREHQAEDGLWFYAVNTLDVPVKVKVKLTDAGRVTGTVDGKAAPLEWTLAPYGLKGFHAERARKDVRPRIVAVETSFDRAAFAWQAESVAKVRALRDKLAARQVAVELPREMVRDTLAVMDGVLRDHAQEKVRAVTDGVRRHEIMYLYELTGDYSPAGFDGPSAPGSYPANGAAFPKLTCAAIIGGDPLEGGAKDLRHFAVTDDRVYVATSPSRGEPVRLREFDRDGNYLRTGKLTSLDVRRELNNGDSRHNFQVDPRYMRSAPIVASNGILYVQLKDRVERYDLRDFRQLPLQLGLTMDFPSVAQPKEIAFKEGANPIERPTQLKVHGGKVWFLGKGALCSLDPQTDVVTKEIPLKGVVNACAFAFDAAGHAFVAGFTQNRDVRLYRMERTATGYGKPEPQNGGKPIVQAWYLSPSDLCVLADGSVLFRTGKWGELAFSAYRDGVVREWFAMPGRHTSQSNAYGLLQCRNGDVVVAGGGTRKVARVSADGAPKWERRYLKSGEEGTFPIRAPIAAAEDDAGRIWIADAARDELVCVEANGNFLGRYGYSATLDDRSGEGFSSISGLAVAGGCLYVADAGNQRLVKLSINPSKKGGKE